MLGAEIFRRRLMSMMRAIGDIDCGYVVLTREGLKTAYDMTMRIAGDGFDISQISSVEINGVPRDVARTYSLDFGGDITAVIRYKNLLSCNSMFDDVGFFYYESETTDKVTVTIVDDIDMTHLDTRLASDFYGFLKNAATWGLSGVGALDVSKATNFSHSFYNLGGANKTSLDLSSWDTRNVTDMSYVFGNESAVNDVSFPSIIVNGWNTSKVTNMEGAFSSQINVMSLDLSSWDTSNVTNMAKMFSRCNGLTELRMLGPTNPNADVTDMFYNNKKNGTFYYNPAYDYSHIIAQLPSTWTAVAVNS